MRLYHGSNVVIHDIDLNKCKPFKDFGKGFYLTPIFNHAQNLAQVRVAKFGGNPIVNEFEFNNELALNDTEIKIKNFEKPDREWIEFVMMNRNSKSSTNRHDYDIVIGPIADDRVAASISLFENDYISIDELIERLKYRELSIQYFFHTTKALKYLKKL